uniref:Uncharacterized protein n=1 Tax=Craspedostauros australis TaxID=1486917 RepID=A0A7R9WQ40_9STRA
MQRSIALSSVRCMLALYSTLVLRITKFCRFGVGIFMAPRNSLRYSDRALARVAAVAGILWSYLFPCDDMAQCSVKCGTLLSPACVIRPIYSLDRYVLLAILGCT